MASDDLMNLSDVARLAGVNKSAVTNWKDRHADFPKPVATAQRGVFFKRSEVMAWLNENRPGSFRLEQWLWEAACQIRGPLDAPKFKDYILPLIFLKRISDVFDDEVARVGDEVGDLPTARKLVDKDHSLVRFYIPLQARWSFITDARAWRDVDEPPRNLAEALTDAVRAVSRQNPRLQGVIDMVDFNATAAGQPIVSPDRLSALVKTLGQHRLGLRDVEPDLLGEAYEYLLRKFAEGQGQSAGEFFTPPEVARLMAHILAPAPGMNVYDPACGSSGLLIKCHTRLLETHGKAMNQHRELPKHIQPLKLYGQEINPSTFAMSVMNAFLHDMDATIELGDTMRSPAFVQGRRLQRFDLVVANPMWNQDFPEDVYRNDNWERFAAGIPPSSSADWGWVQHMAASLSANGRMAVVLDTNAMSRGSGNQGTSRERDIRKYFVDNDLVECVILLPENLFYNTPAAGIVMIVNRAKKHPNEVLLINASPLFVKGRPKNEMREQDISEVAQLYAEWASVAERSTIVSTADVADNDYNLGPSRYLAGTLPDDVMVLDDAVALVRQVDNERAKADAEMWSALAGLGIR
jgi:type I restriction enzyme M protein